MRLACRLQGYTLVVVRASSLLLTQLMAHGRWLRCWQHTAAPRRQRPRVRVAHCASGHCTELSAVIGMSPHLGAPPWTIERVELNKGLTAKGRDEGVTACCTPAPLVVCLTLLTPKLVNSTHLTLRVCPVIPQHRGRHETVVYSSCQTQTLQHREIILNPQ